MGWRRREKECTHTPATTDDDKVGFVDEALILFVLIVAEESTEDGEVLWAAALGVEGEGRDGDAVDVLLGEGERGTG